MITPVGAWIVNINSHKPRGSLIKFEMSLIKVEKFWPFVLQIVCLSLSLSSLWDQHNVYVGPLNGSLRLLIFLHLFFFPCFRLHNFNCLFSIPLIHSIDSLHLLLNTIVNFYFSYCTFKLQNICLAPSYDFYLFIGNLTVFIHNFPDCLQFFCFLSTLKMV